MRGRRKHHRSGRQVFRLRVWKIFCIRLALRHGDVSGGVYELRELIVGDRGAIHPEWGDIHAVHRPGVFHIGVVRSQPEFAAGNLEHSCR
jgi:hypothetical protein